jgi:hypothetical protein
MFSAWLTLAGLIAALLFLLSRTPGGRDSRGKLDSVSGVRTFAMEVAKSGRHTLGGNAARSFLRMAALGLAVICSSAAQAARQHQERWYADALADCLTPARTEIRMRNGTRCDVLATHHAIEVEFAEKWTEGLGQALNYAAQTGRIGAIALILEHDSDKRFLARLREVIAWHQLPISVIVLRPHGRKGLTLEFPVGITGKAEIDFTRPVAAMDFIEKAKNGKAEKRK